MADLQAAFSTLPSPEQSMHALIRAAWAPETAAEVHAVVSKSQTILIAAIAKILGWLLQLCSVSRVSRGLNVAILFWK